MDNYFIAWSGNKPLADKLAEMIEKNTNDRAIVGGGVPKNMYIGMQVMSQIHYCNRAILLVEDKNGQISHNLMFEWGYLVAKIGAENIHTCLINKSKNDLPSDLLGTWVSEITVDRAAETDDDIAAKIFEKYREGKGERIEVNYFDSINSWRSIFAILSKKELLPSSELCHYLITGCFAAYYYMDYRPLRRVLEDIEITDGAAEILAFTKSYIDVFIKSENMMQPLDEETFLRLSEDFEMTIRRKRELDEEIDLLVDILCYDVYGLACILFLRNADLDESMISYFTEKTLECFKIDIELLDKFESTHKNNECLVQLIRAYIYNDLAHVYKNPIGDEKKFLEYLAISVEQRQALYKNFTTIYNNPFLSIKLEQEYIIALSEQCIYMENPVKKKLSQSTIRKKVSEWERELRFTGSLTERIKTNMELF